MTSSILSTFFYLAFITVTGGNIILDTLSNISLLDKYYKKLNSLYNLPFYTQFYIVFDNILDTHSTL